MSLRVAFVCVVPSPYQRDLLAALAARPEVELTVYYMEKAAPDSPWPEKPLAPYEHYLPGFWFGLGGRRIHVNWPLPKTRSYDVVVLNTLMSFTGQWLMRRLTLSRASAFSRHRWMFWGEKLQNVHHFEPSEGGARARQKFRPLHWLARLALYEASGIAGIGQWATRSYQALFPEPKRLTWLLSGPKHFNIPYHCDLTPFLAQPRHRRDGSEVTFLFCGQMIARKGLDLLLEAFAQLDQGARLLLVGREAELPQLLAPLAPEARARVRYAGFQAPDDLPGFFAQADVFVLPSRYDGWGVVVNQALGAGLPIICSDQVGAGYDLVSEGVNGRIFPTGDAARLHAAMQQFLDTPARIDEYGEASRARAAQWQPAEGAARWVAALQKVAA